MEKCCRSYGCGMPYNMSTTIWLALADVIAVLAICYLSTQWIQGAQIVISPLIYHLMIIPYYGIIFMQIANCILGCCAREACC